jgi:hypothetical protein
MLTEPSMKETQRMIKHMDSAFKYKIMDEDMKNSGKRTRGTVTALRLGPMVVRTRATLLRTRDMGKVNIDGAMAALTKESSKRIILRAKVLMINTESLFIRSPSLE